MHNTGYQMWNNNTLSTEAFRGFVEKESNSLQTELILSKYVHLTFAAPALEVGEGLTSAKDITVNEEYPLVSSLLYSLLSFLPSQKMRKVTKSVGNKTKLIRTGDIIGVGNVFVRNSLGSTQLISAMIVSSILKLV